MVHLLVAHVATSYNIISILLDKVQDIDPDRHMDIFSLKSYLFGCIGQKQLIGVYYFMLTNQIEFLPASKHANICRYVCKALHGIPTILHDW